MVTKNANLVEKEFIIMQEIEDEKIEFYEGSDTTFTLNGKQIVIPANLDTFNYYRSKYRRLAKVCADEFVERYIAIRKTMSNTKEIANIIEKMIWLSMNRKKLNLEM